MSIDQWQGIGVYRSDDCERWVRQPDILVTPGQRPDDGALGHHADVLVQGDQAYIFYFTHPGEADKDKEASPGVIPYSYRRTSLQVAQLSVTDGQLTCARDKEGDTYYVLSTGSRLIIICSVDMIKWEWCGRVFASNPDWVNEAVPGVGDLWAPDIVHFAGKWQVYYAGSTFGSNRSVIGLVTNVTLDKNSPDYQWVDEGLVIASQPTDNWNAIDANVAFDKHGQPWLAFGSYWSGIKLRKLDPITGKLATDDETLYPLAQRFTANGSIEGAFIVRRGDYFYLFVSFDYCCRGTDSNYNVRVGRAKEITGPYVDREGKPLREGGGTLILSAYDQWRGPGHNGIYIENETYWIIYHAYDAKQVGIPKLRIESLSWDADGWPSVPSQSKTQ